MRGTYRRTTGARKSDAATSEVETSQIAVKYGPSRTPGASDTATWIRLAFEGHGTVITDYLIHLVVNVHRSNCH